jgi:hypothetical protein
LSLAAVLEKKLLKLLNNFDFVLKIQNVVVA